MKSLNRYACLFLSEKIQKNLDEFEHGKGIIVILLFSTLFITSHSIYLHIIEGGMSFKLFMNYCGLLTIGAGMALLKYARSTIYTAGLICTLAYAIVVIISLQLGGLFEPDIIWLVTLTCASGMFIGRKAGITFAILSTIIFSILMVQHINTYGSLEIPASTRGVKYLCFTLIGNMTVTFIVVHQLVSKNVRKAAKLKELSDAQIHSINQRYESMIHNSRDVISIVNSSCKRLSLSPSASILYPKWRQLLGEDFEVNIHSEDRKKVRQTLQASLTSFTDLTVVFRTAHENPLWIKLFVFPFKESPEGTIQLLTQEQNITKEIEFQEKLKAMREHISRDFHDEIGNKLASLVSTASVIQNKLQDDDNLGYFASKVERNANDIYLNFRDFLWSMKTDDESVNNVFLYLKDFILEQFDSQPIRCNVSTDIADPFVLSHMLDMQQRRNLVLIFKEAVTNIIKHGNATEIHFEMTLQKGEILFNLKDNGDSYNTENEQGMGLKNMRSRAKESSFSLFLHSIPNQNLVQCQLPIYDT